MLTTEEFVSFTTSDLKCINKSEFPHSIAKYKLFVNQANEAIEIDKASLNRVRKGVKTIYNSGTGHSQNELMFCELLEKIGQNEEGDFDVDGDKVATGLCKFAVVMRDLSNKYKQLMQNMGSLVVYPLDMFLKGDIKNDARKPFEKAIKDYETKAEKLKKDRLNALNKENASTIYRPNGDAPFDFSEDLERERRIVQIQLCEFLMKVNEIKSRKGAELVQQLIDYYRAQTDYFKDSLMMMEHMGMFMNDLVQHIDEIKNKHIGENQLLANTRRELRSIIEKNAKQPTPSTQPGYSLHQPQGDKAYGTTKDGWLLKKSDGVVKRVWQKRRVKLSGQSLMLYHGDDNKAPVALPMLTCHIKHPITGDADQLCFDLISNNRTYNFRTEDEKSLQEWLAVLSNAKTAVFEQAMSLDANDDDCLSKRSTYSGDVNSVQKFNSDYYTMYNSNNSMISSTISFNKHSPNFDKKILMKKIRKLDGNERCSDCGGLDPEWVSVNLGVLICLECCGVHRELGVHHSRTQSLRMDTFYCSQLLLPRFVGNRLFNDVYEATMLDEAKPPPSDLTHRSADPNIMQQRRNFIRLKYIDKKFVSSTMGNDKSYLKHDLLSAIQHFSVKDLLQAYGEGVDLMVQFTTEDDPVWGSQLYTAIHLALVLAEKTEKQMTNKRVCMYDINWDDGSQFKTSTCLLTIIEFILQNTPSANLKRVNARGDTILHQAIRSDQVDAIKVILRAGVICSELTNYKNNDGQTAIDLAESLNRLDIVDLLRQTPSESDKDHNVDILDELDIDWGISRGHARPLDNSSDGHAIGDGGHAVMMQVKQPPTNNSRNDSGSSDKSDDSYINFNHSKLISDDSLYQDSKRPQQMEQSDNALEPRITSKELSIARKRSLKGPAPDPPVLRHLEAYAELSKNDYKCVKSPRSKNVIHQKPFAASSNQEGISTTVLKQTHPQSKQRSRPSQNINTSTLPRNLPSTHKKTPLDSKFSQIAEFAEGDQSGSNSNLRTSSYLSHSSDHIDVLLDVLEEPRKPLNAKEVIHTNNPQPITKKEPIGIDGGTEKLKIGTRTSAKFNCKAENLDELSFMKGDIIIVKGNTCEDGWWEGYLENDPSRSGMFPANFVQKLA